MLWPDDYTDYSEKKSEDFKGFEQNQEGSAEDFSSKKYDYQPVKKDNSKTQLIIGLVMIGFGSLFLLGTFIPNIEIRDFWPAALIVIGLVLLLPVRKN